MAEERRWMYCVRWALGSCVHA